MNNTINKYFKNPKFRFVLTNSILYIAERTSKELQKFTNFIYLTY